MIKCDKAYLIFFSREEIYLHKRHSQKELLYRKSIRNILEITWE